MRHVMYGLAAATLASQPVYAQPSADAQSPAAVAAARLAQPPADARIYRTMSGEQERGRHWVWRDASGALWSRQSSTRSGFFAETDQRLVTDAAGLITEAEVRGATTQGDATERYSASTGFVSPADRGPAAPAGSFYRPFGPGLGATIALVDALLRSPAKRLRLHPGGTATISRLATANVANGTETKQLVAYTVDGVGYAALVVWMDGDRYFGTAGRSSTLPQGWHAVAERLNTVQSAALAKRG